MLQRSIDYRHTNLRPAPYAVGRAPHAVRTDSDALLDIVRCLRRNARFILSIAVIGTIVAVVGVFSITPKYMATATLLIDPRTTQILKDADVVGRPGTDNGAIESEVELLQSDATMRRVAQKLNLQNDPEFASGGLLSSVKSLALLPVRMLFGKEASDDPLSGVVYRLDKNVDAKRRGLTYVIELNAWSQDAKKAARIANAFAESYLADQLAVKSEATSRVSKWLNERVDEMRARVSASEKALEEYKSKSNLFDLVNGEKLSGRQVSQLNDQLIDARAKAAAARSKYEQLRQVTPEKLRSAAASPDVLQSTVVSNLRGQYADIAKQQAERESRYGREHPQVVAGRAQLFDTERQITAEINRIVTSAKTEHEMAKSREDSLEASLDELKSKAAELNQASIKMNELDRDVQANRDLFQSFLARAKQTAELSMQVADSRVVSAASVPSSASYPKKALMIGLGFFGSLGLGAALALGRDAFGKGFRHSIDIEQVLGLQPLASIPKVGGLSLPKREVPLLRLDPHNQDNFQMAPARSRQSARVLADYSLNQPDSAFAESVRTLYLSLRQQTPSRQIGVVLVTSALPGEGKSTVAANLGRTAAMAGDNVLLVDADLRRPSLASALDVGSENGLTDVLTGRCPLNTSVKRDRKSGLYVIAGAQYTSGVDALGLLSSPQMTKLIEHARDIFDLVVVDASPLLPVADSRILIEQADRAILVVASEQTSRQAVAAAIRECPDLETKMAGVVLNGTVDDFDRYYVYDRAVIPAHSKI
ncbi:MAG: polysaccharide biosynthesis tyrosine autokinase [Pseudorhodoplanes sp.]|nr:polysaccharide biosynthesis tyrosine autokinase [Pseudorhodoplanes sp.]